MDFLMARHFGAQITLPNLQIGGSTRREGIQVTTTQTGVQMTNNLWFGGTNAWVLDSTYYNSLAAARSNAWIDGFSSTASTSAPSGGSR
jgi:hypothetical protein